MVRSPHGRHRRRGPSWSVVLPPGKPRHPARQAQRTAAGEVRVIDRRDDTTDCIHRGRGHGVIGVTGRLLGLRWRSIQNTPLGWVEHPTAMPRPLAASGSLSGQGAPEGVLEYDAGAPSLTPRPTAGGRRRAPARQKAARRSTARSHRRRGRRSAAARCRPSRPGVG